MTEREELELMADRLQKQINDSWRMIQISQQQLETTRQMIRALDAQKSSEKNP